MRFTSFISLPSLGILLFGTSFLTSCGSFQSSSYYTDGIYNSDNVIVVRRNKKAPVSNAYTQYFDEQAQQYSWENSNESVALTDVDALNQSNYNDLQSSPNWGGGNKTTQIIIQSSPLNFGLAGNWGFGGFYDPYFAYWDYNFFNPYRWNRFAWGFNRPFFNGFFPYYDYGFYGNPYFQGGGFWNGYGYAFNDPYNRRFNRVNNVRGAREIRNNRAYSSTYRGRARTNRSAVTTRAVQRNNNNVNGGSLVDGSSRGVVASNAAETSNQRGRAANTRQEQNLDDTENRVRRTENRQAQQNRSQIDRVIRDMQNNGFDIQVINNVEQARRFSRENQARNVVNQGGRSSNQAISRNNNNTSAEEYRSSRNYSNSSSTKNDNSTTRNSAVNTRSNSSRSYSAPARVSSGGGRSSSSGRSSSGRSSSSSRRQ